eukprot:4779914-Alexandrium_andersonii.AAC.1
MANRTSQRLPRSQQRAEADSVPGLVADSGTVPGPPTGPESLDDQTPDIGARVASQEPMEDGTGHAFTR